MAPTMRAIAGISNNEEVPVGEMLRLLEESLAQVTREMQEMATMHSTGNGHGRSNNQNQFTGMTKVEFPKFYGDDVKGWVLRCEQFFSIDDIPENQKQNSYPCTWKLFSLVFIPEEEDCFKDCSKDDNMEVVEEMPQISLHAMNRVQNYRTLMVKETVGKHTIHFLVDCVSTHKFMDVAVAKKLGCHIRTTRSKFCSDVMLLPLVGWEMILRIQWLFTLGDIKFNFKELRMEFMYKKRRWYLGGTPKSNSEWMTGHKLNKTDRQAKQPKFFSMQLCVYPSPEINLMKIKGITSDVQPKLQQVVEEFADVFAILKELPPSRPCDHRIPLLKGTNSINISPYRHPPTQKEAIESMVQELLDTGVIRQSHSPFASPIVMVKKKDNTWRMCVDYMKLNNSTIKEKFPIPIIEELIDELHGSQIFSKLDLRSGKSLVDHVVHLQSVLQVMRHNQLYAKLSKCVFGSKQVEYLGHVISDKRVAINPSNVKAIENWPVPANVKQLRGFLDLTGHYKRFIKACASISKPLTLLLQKNGFKWNNEAQLAFKQLNQAMTSALVLA
nr:hypothetical protein [Tanacetum cinerariifolium]